MSTPRRADATAHRGGGGSGGGSGGGAHYGGGSGGSGGSGGGHAAKENGADKPTTPKITQFFQTPGSGQRGWGDGTPPSSRHQPASLGFFTPVGGSAAAQPPSKRVRVPRDETRSSSGGGGGGGGRGAHAAAPTSIAPDDLGDDQRMVFDAIVRALLYDLTSYVLFVAPVHSCTLVHSCICSCVCFVSV
jgi:hypothetical protein